MTRDEILGSIRDRFKDNIISVLDKTPKRVYIDIKPDSLKAFVRFIFKELGARFNIASGVDTRNAIEILYHFTFEDVNMIVSLRVKLSKDKPQIASIAPLFEGANWIEREINELLGVNFVGHPDMRKLLLPDEWPQGVYPLRNDYKEWDKNAIRDRGL